MENAFIKFLIDKKIPLQLMITAPVYKEEEINYLLGKLTSDSLFLFSNILHSIKPDLLGKCKELTISIIPTFSDFTIFDSLVNVS